MATLLIVKTGDAFAEVISRHGDFEELFQQQLAPALDEKTSLWVFDAQRETTLPSLAGLSGIVITGSHSMVSDSEPWSEALKPWLQQALAEDVPLLGVCYGHQLMAAAFGGRSDYHPAGRESGTLEVDLTDAGRNDPLLGSLPPRFRAHLTHAQAVVEKPAEAQVLACNSHDPHQALRYGPRQWSVQFHPEFTAPVMRAYLERQRTALSDQGDDPEKLLADVTDTPHASSLLRRFAELV
ncbi:glutamine amidotransferase [Halomonas sp. Bachu 37]|uniref:glutamine amidotransferase n=1 Tax=Halomonas kashgarensis TaxID=3084920 RepID=UPI003216A265